MTERTPLAPRPAKRPKTKHNADVSINDDARYVPNGFEDTTGGYQDYINTAGDLSKEIYKRPNLNGTRADYVTASGGRYQYKPWSAGSAEYGVWVNEETKHAIVVYKGTDTTSEWVFQDTFIASGGVKNQSQFEDAYDL